MYDFDSNNILGKPIKSRDKSELVRGFEMCYKELQEANITPILHRLDNEVSDDLIEAIKKKKLKYQIVTAYDHRQNLAERAIQTYPLMDDVLIYEYISFSILLFLQYCDNDVLKPKNNYYACKVR